MKALRQYAGLALVLAGASLLMIGYLAGWTSSNFVLLTGLIAIVLGVYVHIRCQKRQGKY